MDHPILTEIQQMFVNEHERLKHEFCENSILDSASFKATCDKTFVFRLWCEDHATWHVVPARKRKPWKIVEEVEQEILSYLGRGNHEEALPYNKEKFLREVKRTNKEYFDFIYQLQQNCLDAQKEQRRGSYSDRRKSLISPKIAPEQVPRRLLIEFATCFRKKQYDRLLDSEDAIYKLHPNEVHKMNAYMCKYCSKYHIGHLSTKRRQGKPYDLYPSAKKAWRQYPKEADAFARKYYLLA